MATKTVIIDNIYSDHAIQTSNSLLELAPDTNLHHIGHIPYLRELVDNYKLLTSNLAGSVDVINWSFGVGDYLQTDHVWEGPIRDAFIEGTAVTVSAGNEGGDGVRETQRSPFDFTVGAIQTFEWDVNDIRETPIGLRATKDAVWEMAWFTNHNPTFVDFYTYGDGGTSFASPRVAGLIAQIRDQNPDASLSSIRTILEKNSSYELLEPSFGGSWFVQVLDPYDFENNTARDGEFGLTSFLFSPEVPESEYEFTFTFDDTIDARVRAEALYEIYLNRNPDEEGLEWWTNVLNDANTNFLDVVDTFEYIAENNLDGALDLNDTYEHGVPLVEKIQGLYHAHLGRESDDLEIVTAIDYISSSNLTFNQYMDQWMTNAYHLFDY